MPYLDPAVGKARRANELKSQLIQLLGGKCAECGSTADLEVNHIYMRGWQPRKLTHYRRVLRYWREWHEGQADGVPRLDCRCSECNSRYRPLPLEELEAAREAAATPPPSTQSSLANAVDVETVTVQTQRQVADTQ